MTNFWKDKKVVCTGGSGFLGSHLCDLLRKKECDLFIPRSQDYDLRYPAYVDGLFHRIKDIDVFFNLAANVGGIGYNKKHPYSLFYNNAIMGIGLINSAIEFGVKKFVQVGTTCSYPKWIKPPFSEEALWDGYPEETNAPYGLAKKMLLVQLQAARDEFGFNGIYLLPTNLYGPRDAFAPYRSHVIPALIHKCLEAKEKEETSITVWGTGRATRDFLYVKDAAEGIILAAEKYDRSEPLNLGSNYEVSIASLTHLIAESTEFSGNIVWDVAKPDGQPRRLLNTSRAKDALGWTAKTDLKIGLKQTIEWYKGERLKAKTPMEIT